MEIISILLIIGLAFVFLKALALMLHVGIWMLALPFKILAVLLSAFVVVFVFIPVGLVGALAGLILLPFALIVPLLPFILIAAGVIWLLRRS